ncbi:MAG TPA: dihydrodipicolinate synthase family protein [Bryobacteraceae bacterium]|nr:dihydrodipicolinate synthase family protein [Bryobacteraceae bacterium]
MIKLNGIFSPIATPFDYNGELYQAKVRHNVEQWNRTGLAGYVVGGSTGEAALLSAAEKALLWEWVAGCSGPGKLLIAGTGMESVRETVALTNQAAELGYQAALVLTPHYYRNVLNDGAAQALYFGAVADQARIPLVIYNMPQATGIDLDAATVARLSSHPNIAGIKDSSGNVDKLAEMVRTVQPGFQVLSGSAPALWRSLQAGAAGAVLAVANAVPYAAIAIWEAFRTRDTAAAEDWQARLAHPATLVTARYGIAGLKYAMDLNGYYGGPPRLPLAPASPQAKREIEEAFRHLKG